MSYTCELCGTTRKHFEEFFAHKSSCTGVAVIQPQDRITELETEVAQYQAQETYLYARIQKLEDELYGRTSQTNRENGLPDTCTQSANICS